MVALAEPGVSVPLIVIVEKVSCEITPSAVPFTVMVWPSAKPKSLHESTPERVMVLAPNVNGPVSEVYSSGA